MQIPIDFISLAESLMGDESADFIASLAGSSPTSVRVNPVKSVRNPLSFSTEIEAASVLWSRYGFYLGRRPAFTFDPLLHTGYYYVQEASSMFVEYIVRQLIEEPAVCLDLCAAPGGKSISLLSALPDNSLLVANEYVRSRAHILRENLIKYGSSNCVVTNNAPDAFTPISDFFDLILVDAPCSGEGMFRKDQVAIEEWSLSNVDNCVARQKSILADIWPSLKNGGYLIYSTCTYNKRENEEIAQWMMKEYDAESVSIEIPDEWGVSPSYIEGIEAYRFMPHKVKGEGIFMTVLQKKESSSTNSSNRKKNRYLFDKKKWKKTNDFAKLLKSNSSFVFCDNGGVCNAFPEKYLNELTLFYKHLNIINFGIELGEKKRGNSIPSHSLVLCNEFCREVYSEYALSYNEAIAYLRRESLVLDSVDKGYIVLTYGGEPLGLVKNIGSRANNMYPQEWRIRSTHSKEKEESIFCVNKVNQ